MRSISVVAKKNYEKSMRLRLSASSTKKCNRKCTNLSVKLRYRKKFSKCKNRRLSTYRRTRSNRRNAMRYFSRYGRP